MLVLTRRVGTRLRIGDNLVLTVLGREGSKVKLGFENPAGVPILIEELWGVPSREVEAGGKPSAESLKIPGSVNK